MITLSEEQQHVIDMLSEEPKMNVSVQSVAGSGKTSTVLGIARAFPNKKILGITYNRSLSQETQERIHSQDLENITMNTLHSFVKNKYDINDYTDGCMYMLLETNKDPIGATPFDYDIVVLDEMQDFNDIMFRTCKKIIRDHEKAPQIVVLGDKRQCIYMDMPDRYSDYRFLTYASDVFSDTTPFEWKLCTLQTSYRAHRGISEFINKVVLKEDGHFRSVRDGPKPTYVVAQTYQFQRGNANFRAYIDYFVEEIQRLQIAPQDILILAPKVVPNENKQNNARNLADKISERLNYRVHVNDLEYGNFDKELLKDKVWVSTYHGAKGCERPFVVVLDFDSSFFKYYSKGYSTETCPNAMYVALTRSKQYLYLVQNTRTEPIDFIESSLLEEYCNIVYTGDLKKNAVEDKKSRETKKEKLSPSTLGKYLDETSREYMKQFYELHQTVRINRVFVRNRQGNDKLGLLADVSVYNGHLMTLLFEKYLHGNDGVKNRIHTISEKRLVTKWLIEKRQMLLDKTEEYTIEDLTWLCILKTCAENMTQYQVTNMMNIKKAWVSDTAYKNLIASYRKWISRDASQVQFEVPTHKVNMGIFGEDDHPVELSGCVDIIDHDKKRIIEVKYTDSDSVDSSHILQLLTYYYLLGLNEPAYKDYSLFLMNFRTGQLHQVSPRNDIHQLLRFVIERRHEPPLRISDDDFKELYFPVIDNYNSSL